MFAPPKSRNELQIGILCALSVEYDAMSHAVDEFWDEVNLGRSSADPNSYAYGRIGDVNVVLLVLSRIGKVAAASATVHLRYSFPNLELLLVVGVCGGVPEPQSGNKIFLGDVVIGKAIVQYDVESPCERDTLGESFGTPREKIRNFMTSLESNRTQRRVEAKAAVYLEELQLRAKGKRRAANYQYPGTEKDRLFTPSYRCKHHTPYDIRPNNPGEVCDANRKVLCRGFACGEQQLVVRNLSFDQNLKKVTQFETRSPSVFIGNIGSGDTVLRSAKERERLAKIYDLVAFEMEGAGAWDQLPSIVVKGVCDYADHFKNKEWQNFAAATAAAVSKALIEQYPRTEKPDTRIIESVDETHQGFVYIWGLLCVCVIVTGVHLSGGKQVFNFR
ncbi:hypothetical protein KAF25_007016 [Fusarium avenaceum]|uniref:Nucleoside phosphorylase domain-containing protein n=1 Tax=Fusarium avenaceum TaxID=40199 RepID=A0A9P7KRD6_9HYPO|nr:hypothetical protein KAF25_007016 [Fusarium avenaceum]